MKLKHALLTFALVALPILIPRAADAAGEQITNLSIQANLSKKDVLTVQELINYNFGGSPSHSISHDIPLSYQDDQGDTFQVSIHLIGDNATATTNSTVAHITINPEKSSGNIFLLKYTLSPVILVGQPDDVLKYSATGLGWSVPVNQTSVTLVTPSAPGGLTCTTGVNGATTANCRMTQTGNTSMIVTDAALQPGDNLTIAADFPPGSFTSYLRVASQLGVLLGIAGAAVVALGLVIAIAVWVALKRGSKNLPTEDVE